MSRPPRTVIEYRNYELPADFPIQMLSGENWRISDVPSGVLHFHNCLEIGLCESDGGFLGFRGEQRAFRAGDVTIISGDVPHTTWSDPGTASKWSYLHLAPFELVRPLFPAEALPNGELLQQAVQGHYYILSPQEYPAVQSLVRSMLAEMQQRQMDYAISVRGLFVALGVELRECPAGRDDPGGPGAGIHQPALYGGFPHRDTGPAVRHEPVAFPAGVPGTAVGGAAGTPQPHPHPQGLFADADE